MNMNVVVENVIAHVELASSFSDESSDQSIEPETDYSHIEDTSTRKYSGVYDNIPESWAKLVKSLKFVDDVDNASDSEYLLSLPTYKTPSQ